MDPHDVVMVCLRADDPLEQAVIDQSGIEIVPVADVKGDCSQLRPRLHLLGRTVHALSASPRP